VPKRRIIKIIVLNVFFILSDEDKVLQDYKLSKKQSQPAV
jgi:hypothetical protein